MLVINPTECIDCGVCEPECPAEAIVPDTVPGIDRWTDLNATYSSLWPNVTEKGTRPADAEMHLGEGDKFERYFSAEPGGRAKGADQR